MGVVEDVQDPENRGRVKVRIVGIHSEDKTLVPTDTLPWAEIGLPANNPMLAGRGTSPNGLLPGSCVGGIFTDPDDMQSPLVLFAFGGSRAPGGDVNAGAFNAMGTAIYSDNKNSGCITADADLTKHTANNSTLTGENKQAGVATPVLDSTKPKLPTKLDAPWMTYAKAELDKGITQRNNPDRVNEYLKIAGQGNLVAWCASFVCWCLEQSGHKSPRNASARGLLKHGSLSQIGNLQDYISGKATPPKGAILIFTRGNAPSGHAAFANGTGTSKYVSGLNGNWGYSSGGSRVMIDNNMPRSGLLGVLWPTGSASPDATAPIQRAYNTDCSSAPTDSVGSGSTGSAYTPTGKEEAAFIAAMTTYGIVDLNERRMLWAQCYVETGGYKKFNEIPSKYASSRDKYKGRGFIQVTGEDNYRALSAYVGHDLITDPNWVSACLDNMIKTSLKWWTASNLGAPCRKWAKAGNVDQCSYAINVNPFGAGKGNSLSNVNALSERRKMWQQAQTMKI